MMYTDFKDGQIYEVVADSKDEEYVTLLSPIGQHRTMYTSRVELVLSVENQPVISSDLKVGDIFMDAQRKPGVNKASFLITKVTPTTYTYDIFEKGKKIFTGHEVSKPSINSFIQKGGYVLKKDNQPMTKKPEFKIGDMVKCIDARNTPKGFKLTKGKVYEVVGTISGKGDGIRIVDDTLEINVFRSERFEHVTKIQSIDNKPKFKVGDWVMVNGASTDYPGQIIQYVEHPMGPYLVKFQDPSMGEEWFSENALKIDNQI